MDFAWLNKTLADPDRCLDALRQLYELFQDSAVLAGLDHAVARDLVQETVLSTWQFVKNGGVIPNSTYLMRALANKKIDFLRRRRRQLERETEAFEQQGANQVGMQVAADGEITATDVKAAFEKLRNRAVADRKPHLQDKLRADCEQVWELAAGLRDMTAEIEAEVASGKSSDSRKMVQDRLLQRHRQARIHLHVALDRLIAEGEIPGDQRPFYEMLLQKLLRRQNKRAGASRKQA
jgi:DNA-directed RNA polymerase specialized sigma24 family protein